MSKTTIIRGTGSFVPEKVLTNAELEKMVDTSNEWIMTRTGIKERRIADEKTAASDLAYHSSLRALEAAGVKAEDLDLIIVATITPDMFFPSTACILQDKLSAKKAVAFDLAAACSGFIYGLSVADQFIKNNVYQNILLVGTETLSKITDWTDRNTCVLMGDGSGAVVLGPGEKDEGLLSFYLGADGSSGELLKMPGGGSRAPATHQTIDERLHYIKMRGNELFKVAVKVLAKSVGEALKRAGLSGEEVDLFIPHQANIRIIKAATGKIGISPDKVYINIEKYGNTSSASIPLALDEAVRKGKIKKNDIIVLDAFGGGLTWGACVIRW